MKKFVTITLVTFLILNAVTIFLSVDTRSATGKTIYVDANGGANYTTIQEAVDAAEQDSEINEIFVYSGTYTENIEIIHSITLVGENKDSVIIDGSSRLNKHVVYAHGLDGNNIEFSISGFTIKNAKGNGYDCLALSYVDTGEINDNKIMNSEKSDGIQLDHCSGITISRNTVTDNTQGNGINLIASTNNIIGANNQIQNNQRGISLSLVSNNNIIKENTISGNTRDGVYIIQSSSGNCFYKNVFLDNEQNARDSCTNSWSYNNQGNYWDDYTGVDANHDGVGDTPYNISDGSNQDMYPLGYFVDQNYPPNTPDISGPGTGTTEVTYTYTFEAIDPDGDNIYYRVDWGDNTNSGWLGPYPSGTRRSSSHSWSKQGTYTIKVKAKDINEAESQQYATKTLTISSSSQQNHKPTATIVAVKPSNADYGTTITFSGRGTDEDNDNITGYSWSSNLDGFLSDKPIFTRSNLSSGTHTISFKVKDENGAWSDIATTYVTINQISSQNKPPVADAGGPYSGIVNVSLSFNGTNSYDPDDDDIVSFIWDFGDGTSGTGATAEHMYNSSGNYTVSLTVTDSQGKTSTNSTYANISIQPTGQNGDSGTGGGIPGFEIIFAFVAMALVLLWRRQRHIKK